MKEPKELPIRFAKPCNGVNDQNGDIGFAKDLLCFFYTELPKGANVVKARRVNNGNRAQRQQLHRFIDRVGGGSLLGGNNGERLPGNGIDKTGFSRITSAKKANVCAVGGRRIVHAHSRASLKTEIALSVFNFS